MKNTFKTISVLAAGLIACGLLCQQAQAITITGTVRMNGDVTLDSQDLATAKSATFINPAATVSSGTGSYAGTAGDSVTFSAFGWSPATTPVNPLWSFTDAGTGDTYQFNLGTISSVTHIDSSDLIIKGLGTVTISGGVYDPTGANWSFDITDTSEGGSGSFVFSFAQSDTATVPDGGMTVAFLGFALVGVEGLRRKLKK
jgi:hypothetical protein